MYSTKLRKEVREAIRKGLGTQTEIAQAYQLPTSTVSLWARRRVRRLIKKGVRMKHYSEVLKSKVLNAVYQGATHSAAARRFGMTQVTVSRWVRLDQERPTQRAETVARKEPTPPTFTLTPKAVRLVQRLVREMTL